MKTAFPVTKNPLADLQTLITSQLNFRQILDFGRYLVRVDPDAGRGWFKSEIKTGTFAGTLHMDGKQVISASEPVPPQVLAALERAGYMTDIVRCATGS